MRITEQRTRPALAPVAKPGWSRTLTDIALDPYTRQITPSEVQR